jgi:hypothetical protein
MANYTGNPAAPMTLTVALPGDGADLMASDVNVPFEAMLDDIAVLDAKALNKTGDTMTGDLVFAAGKKLALPGDGAVTINGTTGVSRTRAARGHWEYDPALWTPGRYGSISTAVATVSAPGPSLTWVFDDIPAGVTITDVWVWLKGGPGHSGLPAVVPAFTYQYDDVTTGTNSILSAASDASATSGDYETHHSIHKGSIAHTPDLTKQRISLYLVGEYGVLVQPGLTFYGVQITYTQKGLDT